MSLLEPARRDERSPAAWIDGALAFLFAALAYRLYRGTSPAVVNLDGLGYLKLLPHNFAAGHLLYMPLLRAATAACHGDGLTAGRRLDAASAALAIALVYGCARALVARRAAVFAAAGMTVSYAVWVQGADVEAYAPALCALLLVWAACLAYRAHSSTETALAVGVALGVAVLTHLSHVLASGFVIACLAAPGSAPRPARAHALLALGTGAALSLAAYAWAAFAVRRVDVSGALVWVRTAGHGFRYSGSPLDRVADAVYGLAKAFVWSPYLHEANAQKLLGQFLLGLGAAGVVVGVAIARRRLLPPLPRGPLAAWIAAYAALALAFFGSDHERWLFILPPLWLLAAAAVETLARPGLIGALLVAAIAAANAHCAIGPAMVDTWDRTRAEAAGSMLHDGDLVIFPGHSWDEYIGLYGGHDIHPLPLAYYAGLVGKQGCLARVERDLARAHAAGAGVYVVRLLDEDADPGGLYELGTLGLSRADLRDYFLRLRPRRVPTREPKVTLYALEPDPRP